MEGSPRQGDEVNEEIQRLANTPEMTHAAERMAELFAAADPEALEAAQQSGDLGAMAAALGVDAQELEALTSQALEVAETAQLSLEAQQELLRRHQQQDS